VDLGSDLLADENTPAISQEVQISNRNLYWDDDFHHINWSSMRI